MTTIKKNFAEIHSILVRNEDKKVSEIMDQLVALMVSKQRDTNSYENDDGLWIFCYYHKQWELVGRQVEYGSKASSKTGYNTMCKVGVNCWTKQQRDFKTNKANLLERVMLDDSDENHLDPADLKDAIASLEETKDAIIPLVDFYHEEALEMNEEIDMLAELKEAAESAD